MKKFMFMLLTVVMIIGLYIGFASQVHGVYAATKKSAAHTELDKLTDHEKLKSIVDWYNENWVYDLGCRNVMAKHGFSAWKDCKYHGVCIDSAKFWAYILRLFDIPSCEVRERGNDETNDHQYVIALVDGYWCAWDGASGVSCRPWYDGPYREEGNREIYDRLIERYGGKIADEAMEWDWEENTWVPVFDREDEEEYEE